MMKFAARVMSFFEMTAAQAIKEIRALTEKDRDDLVRYFNEAGMPTER